MLVRSHDVFLPNGHLDRRLFGPAANEALNEAVPAAKATYWETLRAPHLFLGLLSSSDRTVTEWVERLRLNPEKVIRTFQRQFRQSRQRIAPPRLHREFLSLSALAVLRTAYERAEEMGRDRVNQADLLWAILARDAWVTGSFLKRGRSAPMLRMVLAEVERRADAERRAPHSH